MQWEHTVEVEAPVARVWELTVDIDQWPTFLPTVQSVRRLAAGPLRVGSAARLKQPGQPPTVWTVTELEPPFRFGWRASRPGLTMVATHLLEAAGAGCRLTLTLEATGAVARLAGPLIGRQVRRSLAQEAAGFQRAAEHRPVAG
ncbi:MAG TPA: SRPBCC family protein [Natronosporangium sp.]